MSKRKIKVLSNGPYLVSGTISLKEKIIVEKPHINEWSKVKEFLIEKSAALCRCGKSKNAPFCDNSHVREVFNGEETAQMESYMERVVIYKGDKIDLVDDGRCALSRFCHVDGRDVWEWIEQPNDEGNTRRIIKGASACPTGRLTAIDKNGNLIEPLLEEEITVIKEPCRNGCAGIYVQGGIPLESADGTFYEMRNRYILCSCGRSRNKPFCDASHETDFEYESEEETNCDTI